MLALAPIVENDHDYYHPILFITLPDSDPGNKSAFSKTCTYHKTISILQRDFSDTAITFEELFDVPFSDIIRQSSDIDTGPHSATEI